MRFPQHASSGPPGLGRSFILFLAFAFALIVLVTAVPLEENTLLPSRLVARDDPPYPDDYPYPQKADIPPSVTTEKGKSLFYTLLAPKGGATKTQLTSFKKSESLHLVGDTTFTIPPGFDEPKNVKDGNGETDLDKTDSYYRRFIDDLSTVFADKSSGEVFLLLPLTIDGANPGQIACRTTWVRVEYAALTANKNVEKITQVDPGDFTKRKQIYPATGSKLVRRDDSTQDCHDYEAGNAPNIVPPPTGNDDDTASATPTAAATVVPTAAAQPRSLANPECDPTVTYTLSDTQRLANQLTTAGTDQCCTTATGDCAVIKTANSVTANLCGPTPHSQQCTDCAKLGVAMNDLNIDCLNNHQVGGKVAIPYLDGVTLELQPNPIT